MLAKSTKRPKWRNPERGRAKPNKRGRINFEVKFNLNSDELLRTATQVRADEPQPPCEAPPMLPLFDQNGVLFLSKPLKTDEKENKRKMNSVDISNERKKRYLNSKTADVGKKVFKKKIKKRLKLNIGKSIRSICEIPTIDRQTQAVDADAKQ